MNKILIGYEHAQLYEQAQHYALELGKKYKSYQFVVEQETVEGLYLTSERLALKRPGFLPMFADFSAATWQKRMKEGKKQGLIRACKPSKDSKIIDATAGWGRDAAVLASFGAQVLMIERHPLMQILLQDALNRQSEEDRQHLSIALWEGDAAVYLNSLSEMDYPDIIYIDPMHPERQKTALVKKDMQALQQLIGPDEDAMLLLQSALVHARQRVVVKWPQKQQPLCEPSYCIAGKTVRFDVWR
jgi:16S rRNA (guanine1516-N2)-methyltransferase